MREKNITERSALFSMVGMALAAAVFCVTGPLAIPIGPVSISLQTMVLFIAIYTIGTRGATVSCVLYLLMGLVGLPVFTNFQGGLGKLAGPTGGYLIGYIPMILIGGLFIRLSEHFSGKNTNANPTEKAPRLRGVIMPRAIQFLGLVLATVVLYAFGTAWFVISSGTPVGAALGVCVIPFIPGDLVKIIAAIGLGPAIAGLVRHAYD